MREAQQDQCRFWWVNHSQTWAAEISGGFIWSPQEEANGARSQFYDNLLRTSPGDKIISFADTRIRAIGTVQDYAEALRIPAELRASSPRWNDEGWLVPIVWIMVEGPRTKDIIDEIRHLLPQKYSPLIQIDGRGSQKAYLSEISHELYSIVISHCQAHKNEHANFGIRLSSDFKEREEDSIARALAARDPDSSESTYLLKARRGQGIFRERVFGKELSCRITGVTDRSLLIASHIKPWRFCSNTAERLDGENGLLLSPNADLLFDRGLLTFEDDGNARLSRRLASNVSDALLPIQSAPRPLTIGQRHYMNYHRKRIFLR